MTYEGVITSLDTPANHVSGCKRTLGSTCSPREGVGHLHFALKKKKIMLIIFYIYVFQLCHAKWCKMLTECSSSSEDHVSSRRWRKGCDRLSVRKISRTCRKMVKVLLLKAKHIVDMVNFSGRSLQYHFATVTIGCFSPWLSAMIE